MWAFSNLKSLRIIMALEPYMDSGVGPSDIDSGFTATNAKQLAFADALHIFEFKEFSDYHDAPTLFGLRRRSFRHRLWFHHYKRQAVGVC
jgi:hypothetical protein